MKSPHSEMVELLVNDEHVWWFTSMEQAIRCKRNLQKALAIELPKLDGLGSGREKLTKQ